MGIGIGLVISALFIILFPPTLKISNQKIEQMARDMGMVYTYEVKATENIK